MTDQRNGGIAWTDKTWNPIRGCSRVSQGCVNCYAESMAARFSSPGQPYEGLAKMTPSGARWTGEVRLVDKHLGDPLRWKRSRRVFANSMSDLFHEQLSGEQIAAIFGVMAACPQHTFQVLTKRPQRMLEWFTSMSARAKEMESSERGESIGYAEEFLSAAGAGNYELDEDEASATPWPLPNVWLGVSVEDQKTADERIPLLLQCPAAVRFVSYEPALGPVDFRALPFGLAVPKNRILDALAAGSKSATPWHLDWVIVGGESGPNARPFDLDWARSTVEQCRAAGVACFVKQLGARPTTLWINGDACEYLVLRDRAGADPAEWPKELRVQQFPTLQQEAV